MADGCGAAAWGKVKDYWKELRGLFFFLRRIIEFISALGIFLAAGNASRTAGPVDKCKMSAEYCHPTSNSELRIQSLIRAESSLSLPRDF